MGFDGKFRFPEFQAGFTKLTTDSAKEYLLIPTGEYDGALKIK